MTPPQSLLFYDDFVSPYSPGTRAKQLAPMSTKIPQNCPFPFIDHDRHLIQQSNALAQPGEAWSIVSPMFASANEAPTTTNTPTTPNIPNSIQIHSTILPQYTRVDRQTDRQTDRTTDRPSESYHCNRGASVAPRLKSGLVVTQEPCFFYVDWISC